MFFALFVNLTAPELLKSESSEKIIGNWEGNDITIQIIKKGIEFLGCPISNQGKVLNHIEVLKLRFNQGKYTGTIYLTKHQEYQEVICKVIDNTLKIKISSSKASNGQGSQEDKNKLKTLMTMKKHLLYTLLLLIFSSILSTAWAQSGELAGLNFTYLPNSSLKEGGLGNPEARFQELNAFFMIPTVFKNKKNILMNGLRYSLIRPAISNELDNDFINPALNTISYQLIWMRFMKNNWQMTAGILPTISSSFDTSISWDDFIMNGILQFRKRKTRDYSIGFGILLTNQFGILLPIPNFLLTKRSEKKQLDIFLPRYINYEWYLKNWTIGLEMNVNGGRFNNSYASPTIAGTDNSVEFTRYTRVNIGPKIDYRLNKLFILKASGGISLNRVFEFEDAFDEVIDYSVNEGPFIQFGVALKPLRPKRK